MIYKNQILVFIVSVLIAGFFLLSIPEAGFSGNGGATGCCQRTFPQLCINVPGVEECTGDEDTFFVGKICSCGPSQPCMGICEEPPPIPTLNQWGMIIMAGVLGLFAVIGLFVMKRSSVVRPSS